jgi:outer membrane protein assembly factor BamA
MSLARALGAVAGLLLAACGPRVPPPSLEGTYVSRIRFEGNTRDAAHGGLVAPQSDAALQDAIEQRSASGLRVLAARLFSGVDLPRLDESLFPSDARRIETWYAHHGFFDARFLGWEVVRRPARGKLVPVELVGHVEQGLPSKVSAVRVEGWGAVDRVLRRSIERKIGIDVGDLFSLEAYADGKAVVQAELVEHAFAYAHVEGAVLADATARTVEIRYVVEPGRVAKFGSVSIEGNTRTPTDLIEREVAIVPGKGFRTSAIDRTRADLFSTRAFSTVDVVPDLSDPTRGEVPVTIRVAEGKTRSLEMGPSVVIENDQQRLVLAVSLRDDNVLHRLVTWDQGIEVGAATLVNNLDTPLDEQLVNTLSPVAELRESLALRRIGATDFGARIDGSIGVGAKPDYRYFAPTATPRVEFRGVRHAVLSLGYRLTYFDYCLANVAGQFCPDFVTSITDADDFDPPQGLDFKDPYFLSVLEPSVEVDRRNDPMSATRGWYFLARAGLAGGPLGGDNEFWKLDVDARLYRSIVSLWGWRPGLSLAFRGGAGVIEGFGRDPVVGFGERFYLGGATTVRGWGSGRLGTALYTDRSGSYIASGGLAQLYGSAEVRKTLPWSLSAAVFVDGGRAWEGWRAISLPGIMWTAGAGLRYRSPVGPIRFDVGFRLNNDPAEFSPGPCVRCGAKDEVYRDEPAWGAVHLAIGEAF